MNTMEVEGQTIERRNFSNEPFEKYYLRCRFAHCCFSEAVMGKTVFEKCTFDTCDFSLSKMEKTAFHEALFIGCKMVGVDFSDCNPYSSFRFERCQMHYVGFQSLKITKTCFVDCDLTEADFTDTNLQGSLFTDCNMDRTVFRNTNLTAVDFSTARHLLLNPLDNRLKETVFSRYSMDGVVAYLGIKLKD